MKKNKPLKILITILIILLIILIIAVAALALLYNYALKPHSEIIETAVETIVNDEEIMHKIEPYLDAEALEKLIQSGGEVFGSPDSQTDTQSPQDSENTSPSVKKPKKSASDYASKYDYVKDNVAPSDFAQGMALAGKIDIGYILGLLADGLTPDEKQELKEYLTSHLSAGEIAQGIALYSKYSDLLK